MIKEMLIKVKQLCPIVGARDFISVSQGSDANFYLTLHGIMLYLWNIITFDFVWGFVLKYSIVSRSEQV